jgi:regulator of CtrA degradation
MHVIAWLLTQRAVTAGELTPAQAGEPDRRIGDAADTDEALLPRLPDAASELIRSSEELYERVRRLDESRFGAGPSSSPARSLLNRLERSL